MPYFDNAATTFPKPEGVVSAVTECMQEYAANPGRSGHAMALKMDRAIYETRERLTKFVGGDDPLRLIFTYNCTDSLNLAIHGILKEGAHVVTTSMEHNSVNRPLMEHKNRGDIELTVVDADKEGRVDSRALLSAVRDDTALVCMTHMSNLTGTIQPVEEVGRALKDTKTVFLVDAAQSLGVLPVDISFMGIDLLCFPGHKGLYGPMGTGGLYVGKEILLHPIKQGGTGSFSQDFVQPELLPDALESGTPNGPGIIGLGEGLAFLEQTGIGAIHQKEMALFHRMKDGLHGVEGITLYGPLDERQGPVLSLNIEGMDSAEVAWHLDEKYEIQVRPGLHCAPLAHRTLGTIDTGAVRFSFSYFNTEEEVDLAVSALRAMAGER